jgi:WD40 repeat protein
MLAVGFADGVVELRRLVRAAAGDVSQRWSVQPDAVAAFATPPRIYTSPLRDRREVAAVDFLSSQPTQLVIVHKDTQIFIATQSLADGGFDYRAVEADVGSRVYGSRSEEDNDHYAAVAVSTDRVLYTVLEDAVEAWDFKHLRSRPDTNRAWQVPVVRNETGARNLRHLAAGDDFLIGQGYFRTWVWERDTGASSKLVRDTVPGTRTRVPGEFIFYPQAVAFDPAGDLIVGSSLYGLQRWRRAPDGQWRSAALGRCGDPRSVRALSLSPDRTLVAAASSRNQLMVVALDRPGDPLLCSDSRHTDGLWAVAFSHDGRWLASGDWDSNLLLWQMGAQRQISYVGSIPVRGDHVSALAFHPERNLLAVGMRSDEVQLVAVGDDGAVLSLGTLPFPGGKSVGAVLSLDFSRDGSKLAAAGGNGPIQVWDLAPAAGDGTAIGAVPAGPPLLGHAGGTRTLAFNPGNALLVSGGADGLVRVWDSEHPERTPATLRGVDADVLAVAWSDDGKHLATSFKELPQIGPETRDDEVRHGQILTWSWDLEDFHRIACDALWPSAIDDPSRLACVTIGD